MVESNLIASSGASYASFSPAVSRLSSPLSSSLLIEGNSGDTTILGEQQLRLASYRRSINWSRNPQENAESHIHICPYGYQSSKNDCSSRLVGIAMLWDTQKFRQHERCIGTSVYVIMKQILCVKPFDVILFVGTTLCNPLCLNLYLALCLASAFNQPDHIFLGYDD